MTIYLSLIIAVIVVMTGSRDHSNRNEYENVQNSHESSKKKFSTLCICLRMIES